MSEDIFDDVNTLGMEMRAESLFSDRSIGTSADFEGKIERINQRGVYPKDTDFPAILHQLAEQLGQPDAYDFLRQIEPINQASAAEVFEHFEDEGMNVTQAAILGVALGYSPVRLQALLDNAQVTLPFTMQEAREKWVERMLALNPACAEALALPELDYARIDPELASVLDPSFVIPVAPVSKVKHVYEPANTSILHLQKEAAATLQLFQEVIGGVSEKHTNLSACDAEIGEHIGKLLRSLVGLYVSNLKTPINDKDKLCAYLAVAAGWDAKRKAYFEPDEIKRILEDKISTDNLLLKASEWAEKRVGVEGLLATLLYTDDPKILRPYIETMCNARIAVNALSQQVDNVKMPKPPAYKRSIEFTAMVDAQKEVIEEYKAKTSQGRSLSPEEATDFFNALININTTISGKEPATKSNREIAEFLASDVVGQSTTSINRDQQDDLDRKKEELTELINNIRLAHDFNPQAFEDIEQGSLHTLMERVLFRGHRKNGLAKDVLAMLGDTQHVGVGRWGAIISQPVEAASRG